MNCERVEQLLSEHLEGLVSEREVGAMETHLGQCPACRRLQDEFLALRSRLRALAQKIPEAEVERQAIDLWLAERETSNGSWWNWFGSASTPPVVRRLCLGGAAAALFLAVLAFYWYGHARVTRPHSDLLAKGPHPAQSRHAFRPTAETTQDTHGRLTFTLPSVPPGEKDKVRQPSMPLPAGGDPRTARDNRSQPSTFRPRDPVVDDLARLNRDPKEAVQQWAPRTPDEWEQIEARVKKTIRVRDDFVRIPFPRLVSTAADQIARSAESYKREAAIVDPRLAHEVTCAFKATALSDLCDQLRNDTGIQLSAGPSVADEKVTLFCGKMPLREVMRQLSRPFGYTWLRSKREVGGYRYELVQDLKSQLLEEELRNRDRDEALLALQQEMERYRPYLQLSPDEARARANSTSPGDKPLLEKLAAYGWGAIQMYFRLSPRDLAALRAGQKLTFSEEPGPGEQPLPRELVRGVLQSQTLHRLVRTADGSFDVRAVWDAPNGLPVTAVPEMRAHVKVEMSQSELGQFALTGASGFFGAGLNNWAELGSPWAVGRSRSVLQPDNAAANATLAHDPAFLPRVNVEPLARDRPAMVASDPTSPPTATHPTPNNPASSSPRKITSADVLEAVYRATGTPIISDYYTRLFSPESVSVKNRPLFEALNHVAVTMRLRWHREDGWLEFRSSSFFDDRIKEVPNRLLNRWAASRQKHGFLTLDDLVEIAQLSDEQLNAAEMAEGARDLFGLVEWDLARNKDRRPHLRFLAGFTPTQRQEALGAAGLPFTQMPLAQQQRFIPLALGEQGRPLQSLEELAGATLRIDYSQPGGFEWRVPGPYWLRWIVPLERGRRTLRPVVRERTREAALQALRRVDPQIREAISQSVRRADPQTQTSFPGDEDQIVPTEQDLVFIYMPDTANRCNVHVVWGASDSDWTTW